MNVEKALAMKQMQKKDKADSTKRMGNHSEDDGVKMDLALNKNPINGRISLHVRPEDADACHSDQIRQPCDSVTPQTRPRTCPTQVYFQKSRRRSEETTRTEKIELYNNDTFNVK